MDEPIIRLRSKRNHLRKGWNIFIWCLILAGFPLLAWAGYSLTSEAYAFSKYGVETRATVIALETTSGGKSPTWYYKLRINGQEMTAGFSCRLPVNHEVSVLVLPNEPHKMALGDRNSTWFDLFAHAIGGKFMASLVIAMFLFMLFKGPQAFLELIRGRRAFFNLRS